MKKNNALITILLMIISFNTYSMETPDPKKVGWIALAGATIIGGALAYRQFLSYVHTEPLQQSSFIDPFDFSGLPEDMQKTIIALLAENSSAPSLHSAAQTITALTQTNKKLHQLINEPQFCLQIIKHLAERFNCSDEKAAQALHTKEAKHRLTMQQQFSKLFLKKDFTLHEQNEFNLLYAKYKELGISIDLNFTYGDDENKQTLLLIASTMEHDNTMKIECLLNTHAVNVNCVNMYGFTPLMLCATNSTNPRAVEILCQYRSINIDQQNNKGETSVMSLCKFCHTLFYKQANLQVLLDYGADPEIKNNENLTPLKVAEKRKCLIAVEMLQQAINKKYTKK